MGDTVRTDDLTIAEFPAASREQWLALVASVLKGAPFEKRLVSKTYDGISVAPLYERDDGARVVFGRKAGTPWRIVQRIEFTDTAAANAQALHDLENGATGLTLLFNGATGAYGFGLAGDASLERVLKGVVLDAGVAIDLQPGPHAADVARQLTDVIRGQGISPAAVTSDSDSIRSAKSPLAVDALHRGARKAEGSQPPSTALLPKATRVHSRSRMGASFTMRVAPKP